MRRYKDLWFSEYERHVNSLEGSGVHSTIAMTLAGTMADQSAAARLADMADRAKDEAKERSFK